MGLVDQVVAAQLPSPERRRMIRVAAKASLFDVAEEMKRRGHPVTSVSVLRWEQGVDPRRDRAIAYRQLLDELAAVIQ